MKVKISNFEANGQDLYLFADIEVGDKVGSIEYNTVWRDICSVSGFNFCKHGSVLTHFEARVMDIIDKAIMEAAEKINAALKDVTIEFELED